MNPFEIVKTLFTTDDLTVLSGSKDEFIVNRWISFNPSTFFTAVKCGRYIGRLPSWAIYSFLNIHIKKRHSAPFIKYIKKKKETIDKDVLNVIGQHFCSSDRTSKEIISLLEMQSIDIANEFGINKKRKRK